MRESIPSRCSYLRHAFESEAEIISQARDVLFDVDYDTFVGTGLSGALVVPILGRALGKNWMIVRKAGEGSHSGLVAEGDLGRRWLFVDDLIDSGTTQTRVMEAINKLAGGWGDFATTYVGDYLYHHGGEFRLSSVPDVTLDLQPAGL